jgi:uncharacterized RDD family membrane protein YckC
MTSTYAGFWLRFVAYIIDFIIIYVVQSFILVPLFALMGLSLATQMPDPDSMTDAQAMGMVGSLMAAAGVASLISTVIGIFYWTLMESSKYQATIGKLALGLRVTDMDGKNLDFVKALIRNVSKIISGMILLIGYIMVGFTEKSQGLHDIIAGTLVVKK